MVPSAQQRLAALWLLGLASEHKASYGSFWAYGSCLTLPTSGVSLTTSSVLTGRPAVFRQGFCSRSTKRVAAARCAPRKGEQQQANFAPLSTIFLVLLVVHKCLTDGLSRYTRISGIAYSATTVAILGEVAKVPVHLVSILVFEGKSALHPILRSTITNQPFALAFCGLAYSVQNILYFQALSHLSAASYQLLSQSKLLFTAFFMSVMLKRHLRGHQYVALLLLLLGTGFTQLSEIPRSASMGGDALYGGILTLLGAALSALPNVHYEKVLKTRKESQWVMNIQITFWIWFWLMLISLPSLFRSGNVQQWTLTNMLAGVTPWVWLVIILQSFKCVLIPATLKYADNILYSYVKPASILVTALVAAIVSRLVPSLQFVLGAALIFGSMWLYDS